MTIGKRMKGIWSLIVICLTFMSCDYSNQAYELLPEDVDFNFHIRPILVQNCYLCHGPDPSSRKANLRLDTYEGATAELKDGGFAVVPGNPSESKLIDRINDQHEDKIMPPLETNNKLTQRDKDLLEKWIDQGAEWKPHWSFIKPDVKNETNDIDFYVNNYLNQKKLDKAPIANKNKLIRRVSYLLTGLPPSTKDIENYISDTSQDAYENMVEYYLNSLAYGERWARHWMDLVRYSETKGHEMDFAITGVWQYRDYLIRAFNEDLPYDQLLKEHLAGDLLEKKRYNHQDGVLASSIATAFYTLGEGTHSPVDVKQDEVVRIDNMIDVTTKTFQGLTVSCARCHDHKFDPITAADYYALYGVMESTRFTQIDTDQSMSKIVTAKEVSEIQHYIKTVVSEKVQPKMAYNKLTDSLNNTHKMMGDFRNSGFDGWVSSGYAFGNRTTLGNPLIDKSSGKLLALDQGKASSKFFDTGIFGTLRSTNFIIDSDFIGVRAQGIKSSIRIVIDNFQLIQDPIYGKLTKGVDSLGWKNYTFKVEAWKGHKAYIEILTGKYKRQHFEFDENAFIEAKYAISYDNEWPEELSKDSSPKFKTLNSKLKSGKIRAYFPELIPKIDSSERRIKDLKSSSFICGVSDGFAINSPVFNRGKYQDPSKDSIPRRFLSALPSGNVAFKSGGSGRLELANAMLHPENPLTSRVMANRIWHYLFGRGIVETVDNFGLQGKLPSNPELLDHLAINFKNNGWSIKKLIKYIVTSETFKRSTATNKKQLTKDPNNVYLASFPVRRLESEALRDGILVASESLNDTLYGPPVPTHLTKFMQGIGRPKTSGPLNGNSRRSIYQEVRRNFLDPMMTTFDRPIPFTTFGKRDVTNVPSQSLILMNDSFVVKQAEIMAQKLLEKNNLSFNQRIEWVYLHAFSRKPTENEIVNAVEFIEKLKKIKIDNKDKGWDLTIWKEYCHSIFNLKEFLYLM